jgi:hypothetical protein
MWWQQRTTQPHQLQSMRTLYAALTDYLAGRSMADAANEASYAMGFIRRIYDWLGPQSQLTDVQRLMLRRMLLTVEYFTKLSDTVPSQFPDQAALKNAEAVAKDLFAEGGQGSRLDDEIAKKAGLPKICPRWDERLQGIVDSINDDRKKELYQICSSIASGVYTLSDCHHNTFRFIEGWVYGIGTGQLNLPTRKAGSERERLGRLLLGYVLGLDKWLLGRPLQFLLMDLGHLDLGFDPKNEVLRVFAYLGEERSPVKLWLAACLWHNLSYAPIDSAHPAGLMGHTELLERVAALGVSVREWMDSAVGSRSTRTDT